LVHLPHGRISCCAHYGDTSDALYHNAVSNLTLPVGWGPVLRDGSGGFPLDRLGILGTTYVVS
jgi:hypothetical protein